jgi:hypothetical protein
MTTGPTTPVGETLPRPQPHVVMTEMDGGESVLVDLNTRRYYQMNETATLVWRAMSEGKTRKDVIAQLTTVYEVTEEHAQGSLARILEQWTVQQLVSTAGR